MDIAAPAPAQTSNINGPGTGSVIPTVPGANPNAALQTPGTMGGAGQALLVTSSAARTATANNVSKLQTITTPPATNTQTNNTSTTGNTSTVTQPATGTAGAYKLDSSTGNITDNAGSLVAAKDTSGGYSSVKNASGQVLTGVDAQGNLVFGSGGSAAPSTSSTDGSGASTDPYDAAVASISDPGIAAQFKSSLQALDTQISTAQTNLQNAQALAQNDPAATAAIAAIQAKYDQQISLMKAKNTQILGNVSNSVAAFGGLGPMSQDFLNSEQQQADDRIGTLVSQEQDAITKATIAYQTNDMKALNTAMTAYDTANKSKLQALNDLLTASSKQVTQMQAQQKIDAAATKQQVTLDISKSANLGAAIAKNITDSGLTDPTQISDYIASVAQEYGITNPDILSSAVTKAQQAATKASDASANTANTIQNRNARTTIAANKAGGGSTGGSLSAAQLNALGNSLNNGDSYGGTTYNARGADGFVDPNLYNTIYTSLKAQSPTKAQQFLTKYPPAKHINPANVTDGNLDGLDPVIINAVTAAANKKTGSTPQYSTN